MSQEHEVRQGGISTIFVGEYGRMYGKCFQKNEFYEQEFLEYVKSLSLSGTYLDVGANIGNHSLYFRMHCKADAVVAFEPLAKNIQYIRNNISRNGLTNISIVESGLGRCRSRKIIKLKGGAFEIATEQLDRLHTLIPGRVSLIKIDVEGMEIEVIRGGRERICRDRPVIFAEADSAEKFDALKSELATIGYEATGRRWNASATYEFR